MATNQDPFQLDTQDTTDPSAQTVKATAANVGASPDTNLTTPTSEAPSVATQLTGLLERDNPYLKSAETSGLQQAATRGLLNSSLAVQSAEQARINSALPIAQQDAGYQQQKGVITHTTNENLRQAAGEVPIQKELMTASTNEAIRQSAAETEQQKALEAFSSNEALRRAGFSMSGNLQGQLGQHIQNLQEQASQLVQTVELSPNMDPSTKQSIIDNALAQRDADIQFISSVYSQLPVWQASWTLFDEPTAPAPIQ